MNDHPIAKIGKGVLFDYGTRIVIDEMMSINDNILILHHITLGSTGKQGGHRHPKIGNNLLINVGAMITRNVEIGEGAKIRVKVVVLINVPPHTLAIGNHARFIGGKCNPTKLIEIPSKTMDHTSFIGEWFDYVI